MRVLVLDMEGGYGGSSRSLYFSLKNMAPGAVEAEVWCRKPGPIQPAYATLGIPTRIEPGLGTYGAVNRLPHSLYDFARGAINLAWRDRGLVDRLVEAVNDRFDLLHFNHEGLWMLAHMVRKRIRKPMTMHVRKVLPVNAFARLQVAAIGRSVRSLVTITEGERETFARLGNRLPCKVIYNIAEPMGGVEPHPGIPLDGRLRVASIANYSWGRGVDLVLDVIEALRRRGRDDVLFVFAGNLRLSASLPGRLGEIGRAGGGVSELAAERGLSGNCLFLGHVSQPERVMEACHALIKTARKDLPWGRDLLEALRAGRPVVTTGTADTFVKSGETGLLMPQLDAELAADTLADWADDRELLARLGENGRQRAAQLCDGPTRAADLLAFWQEALA